MDPLTVAGWSGLAALLAWLGYSSRSGPRRTRRVLRRTRVTPIAKLVDGKLACVVGRVEAEGDLVHSLMARRPCVAYETIARMLDRHAITTRTDVTRQLVPFFVVDATGRARVDAAEAALANRPIATGERFQERIIENGATIRIVGSVSLDPAKSSGEHGFREGGWTATLTGTSKFPLLVDVED